jgi:two-component system NtrC family sensor kinase
MPDTPAPQSATSQFSKDVQGRLATIRLLQLLAVAALLLPLVLFLFAGLLNYRTTEALANERIERSLEILQEQALKVFQSMNLALDSVDNLLADRSDAQIQADGAMLHQRLRQILSALPEVQSIWIFGPNGHPQVITREYPAPAAQDFSSEDYFNVPKDGYSGVYIGGIHQSASGGQSYFTFNRARHDSAGKFLGVIEMSLLPSDFTTFYSQLAITPGLQFALVREDGTILARIPPPSKMRLDENSGFLTAVQYHPAQAFYTSTSELDHIERRIGVRHLPNYPVYVIAGIATEEIQKEWMSGMAPHLIFGIPATAFLFVAPLVVLRRTKRLYAEQDRRETAEIALRQSQKLDAIGHLTGGVAHDFNNLLTIIIGNLEIAQRQLESWTEGAQVKLSRQLENVMLGAQRAATLTKRLLAFSRQQPLNPVTLDLDRLLHRLSEFFRRTLGEDISLEIVGGGGVWPIEADPVELETAILNLVVNARDAMPSGGKLTIEVSNSYLDDAYCRKHQDVRTGQYVQLAVSDTGTGMNTGTIERAFEPFFTTKPTGQGTGLGLSQVYGFVKQSGGHVKIYSEVGEGTTVKLYLPRSLGQYIPEETLNPQASRARPGECVLVVEDDADVRAYVGETLGRLGYDVLEAAGGKEALLLLEKHASTNLLLTDVVMPGMNGRKLADEARKRRSGLKVVFMTGYSRNAIVHQGRLDPGVELIQKPLRSEHLAATIRRVLDT